MDGHPDHILCRPALVLLTATGLVILGTLWVDPTRLWLLLVPVSFLVTAWGAGAWVDRTVGGLLQGPCLPPMLNMAVRIGVGVACLSLLAVASAFCRVFWVSGIVALPCMAFGLLRLTRAGFRLRCSLAAWGLAEGITGPGASLWAAPLVAGALATSPMLWFLATLPFTETALVAAVVTAVVVLVAPSAERRPWLALGLVLGLAASVKLAGLYWVVAGLAATAVAGWTGRDTLRAGAVALASVAPWWVRAFVHTGNPIYPMAYGLLGGRPWSEESQARVMAGLPHGVPGSLGVGGLLSLPLDLVQHPERFGSASEAGVLAVAATCLVLALPVISRVVGLSERGRRLGDAAAIFVALSGAGWVLTSPTTRFFAPAFVVGLAGLVGTLLYLRRAGRVVALIVILVGGVWGTARFLDQHAAVFSSLEVALGRESADAYLARRLDHFAAARFVQERLPPDARLLLIGETRPYYFYREAVAPSAYDVHPLHRWVQESPSPEALAKRLATEGFTHVVLNIYELKRLHDNYGLLAFSGDGAEANTRRLRELPRALRLLFAANGVFVFEVPRP